LLYIRQYIAQFPDVDAEQVANLLVDAGTANGVDPLLLMCLARYESTFNVADVGAAGERGLLQVHPCHRRAMKRAGLDFYTEADRLAFACRLYNAQGLKPWTVRRRALALYDELRGEV
jgi:soluble lytic murein transglycosylase-like protein